MEFLRNRVEKRRWTLSFVAARIEWATDRIAAGHDCCFHIAGVGSTLACVEVHHDTMRPGCGPH